MTSLTTKKKSEKKLQIDMIWNPNKDGVSDWIEREKWEGTCLDWGTNGTARHGIYFGDKRYKWDVKRGKHRKVIALRMIGFSDDVLYGANRPIRSDIKKHYMEKGCVVCGSNSDLVTDHKNDSYNDQRVLNTKTQTIDDFQCLCNHCNLQKRQIAKKTKETGKRIGATKIPQLYVFGIDFIEGDDTYDETAINPMKGTYWHDPIAFMNFLMNYSKSSNSENLS
jgi:hypothetical protein